jgi:hypothetical protein
MLDSGLLESVRSLERESGVLLSKTDAADNVNLRGVMQEWEVGTTRSRCCPPRHSHGLLFVRFSAQPESFLSL